MSTSDHVDAIDTTVQKTYTWIREICEELGYANRRKGYQVLRGVLHTLRDRLPVDEATNLGAQLPILIRGIYYEGWHPSHKPDKMTVDEFFDRVAAEAILEGRDAAIDAVRAVFNTLRKEISPAEVDDILDILPKDLHGVLAGGHRHTV
jgi:uncharacterized protein (DUF2267 family)